MYDSIPQWVSKIRQVKVQHSLSFQRWPLLFLYPLEVKGHTVAHLKALRCGKYELRGLSSGSSSSICQVVLKNGNLLHKQGSVNSQIKTTVVLSKILSLQSCIQGSNIFYSFAQYHWVRLYVIKINKLEQSFHIVLSH